MEELTALQGWMQDAMLEPSAVVEGTVPALIQGDQTLPADARLAIYMRSYRLRLLECLRSEYPVMEALVGPAVFELFARGYCAASPSSSYTLYDFGAGFADYLDQVRPVGDGTPAAIEAIPAALARIERARAEVSRARGVEGRPGFSDKAGMDSFVAALLGIGYQGSYARPDSVRLLALPFDFTRLLSAVEQGEAPVPPEIVPSFMAIGRAQYRIRCHRLEAWQFAWLAKLPVMGEESVAMSDEAAADRQLVAWLPFAVRHGLAVRYGE